MYLRFRGNIILMDLAIEEAKKAQSLGEVPVGAVIVKQGYVIAKAHNLKETLKNPLAHAEILAINEACKKLNNWRLSDCEMYVTLEPCPMCAGAILQSRISKVYIGTLDDTTGAGGSIVNILQNPNLPYFVDLVWHHDERCSEILVNFFKRRRIK